MIVKGSMDDDLLLAKLMVGYASALTTEIVLHGVHPETVLGTSEYMGFCAVIRVIHERLEGVELKDAVSKVDGEMEIEWAQMEQAILETKPNHRKM